MSMCQNVRRKVTAICRRLNKAYGPVEPGDRGPVLDELVGTILSQNTSDTNSHAAFEELTRRFPDWDAVRRAPVRRIAAAIRRGGLAGQKAPRIKRILQQVQAERGEISLEFLRDVAPDEAMEYLTTFDGIGPKTAACVLLFACDKPVLPVDTHVHRVSRRLGLIGPNVDAARAHDELPRLVPPRLVLEFHVGLIRHGRRVCRARNPGCEECPLLDLCEEGPRFLRPTL
jgi:endonuclease III